MDLTAERLHRLAGGVDDLFEQMKLLTSNIARDSADVARRLDRVAGRMSHLERETREARSELALQADQIINARHEVPRAAPRLDDLARAADPAGTER